MIYKKHQDNIWKRSESEKLSQSIHCVSLFDTFVVYGTDTRGMFYVYDMGAMKIFDFLYDKNNIINVKQLDKQRRYKAWLGMLQFIENLYIMHMEVMEETVEQQSNIRSNQYLRYSK